MLKVELHAHTADDPVDNIPHSAHELIDRAARLGYGALAITLHERCFDPKPLTAYARERGIVLIRGVERTIEGRHVLLLNFSSAAEGVTTFVDLARLRRREHGLVVAPHPFFPTGTGLGRLLTRHAELFDAVERNAMFTSLVDFNAAAERWAAAYGKPMVGNGDVHRLTQLGSCYSLVDAAPDPDSICEAIRSGRVEVKAEPLSLVRAGITLADMFSAQLLARGRAGILRPASA